MTGMQQVRDCPAATTRNPADASVLVTGAGGEVGHGLLAALQAAGHEHVVAIDVRELPEPQQALCHAAHVGDIRDRAFIEELITEHRFTEVYHLAALLSQQAERKPRLAHEVNVDATVNLLLLAVQQEAETGTAVKFVFPSSIAVYGIPDVETKVGAGRVPEDVYCEPITMYGCNKLSIERLGHYFVRRHGLDFRCVRFPGLISADTLPSGGTSDYAPEMIHAAVGGERYVSFVRPDTRIPFMTMPDAIDALLQLAAVDRGRLTRPVYNITGFSPSAEEIAKALRALAIEVEVEFDVDAPRQAIVDSWPAELDDTAARRDWGFDPRHDLESALEDYLLPGLRDRATQA